MATQVFMSCFSFKKKKLIIADSIGARATIINVFAALVLSIEIIKTCFNLLFRIAVFWPTQGWDLSFLLTVTSDQ